MLKPRVSVLIKKENKVLFIKRTKNNRPIYYVLPGGGVEPGETCNEAATREVKEELGISIDILETKSIGVNDGRDSFLVIASIEKNGIPRWIEHHKQEEHNTYEIEWINSSDIDKLECYPKNIEAYI